MINTILEVLVAVVVLIVIIAVLALRYLRADDSDTFDDIPDEPRRNRREPESPRDRVAAAAHPGRRPRSPEPVAEPAWQADGRPQAGFRDRDTGPRPVSPDRTAAAEPGRSRREPVSARAGRQARPPEADSLTNSWESMSDVDYWAELAADKAPASPAAGPVPAGRSRSSQPVSADVRPPAASRPGTRADQARLPVRQRQPAARSAGSPGRPAEAAQTEQFDLRGGQPPGGYPNESGTAALEALSRRAPTSPQRSAAGSRELAGQRPAAAPRPSQAPRPQQPAVQAAAPSARRRAPAPADDDPLTSPSFPAVTAADSRSYRTRRHPGQPDGPQPNGRSGGVNGYGGPGQQFDSYPPVSDRATSRPDGYPVQASAPPTAPVAQAPASAPVLPPTLPQSAAPAANPYGSYVSAPQHSYTEPVTQQSASFATPAPGHDAPSYGGYHTGQQPVPGNSWYGDPASATTTGPALPQPFGQPADGYLPPAGLGGNGAANGSHLTHPRSANGSAGYAGIDYGTIRYDTPVYGDGQQALAGYGSAAGQPSGQYDQHGYGPDPAYGQDGSPGYPRHGADGR